MMDPWDFRVMSQSDTREMKKTEGRDLGSRVPEEISLVDGGQYRCGGDTSAGVIPG